MMRPVTLVAILAGMAAGLQALPARAQDESDVVVRLSQLEAQMRQMSGKIEELQFQNQQLRDQLKRFRQIPAHPRIERQRDRSDERG